MTVMTALCDALVPYGLDGPDDSEAATRNFAMRLAQLDEVRERASTRSISEATKQVEWGVLWEPLHEGDLVLLRRFEVDRNKGMKLAARWEGPYELTDLSWHKRSGRLRDINTGEVVRVRKGGLRERCHVNDMKLFVPREDRWIGYDGDKGTQKEPARGTNFVGVMEYGRRWAAGRDLVDLWTAGL